MSKQYSKSELEKKSKEYFSTNKEVKEIFFTTDGQPFLMENRADIHAKASKLDVFGFKNSNENKSAENESEILASNSTTAIGLIKQEISVEALKALLTIENSGKKRVSVIGVIEKRIAELEDSSEDLVSEDEGQEDLEGKNENQDNPTE